MKMSSMHKESRSILRVSISREHCNHHRCLELRSTVYLLLIKTAYFIGELENCTWNETQWSDWGKCINLDGCGSGYMLRMRDHCVCGKYNQTQENNNICGIPPTHIKSCYVPCRG